MTLRLAMLTFYPEDSRVVPGGIRMVAYNLVQALLAYPDLELHVVHCHSDISRDHTVQNGRAMLHFLALPRQRIVPNLVTGVQRLIRMLHAIDPHLVHAHAGHLAYASVAAGYPTIYTIHGVLPLERQVYSGSLFDRLRYGLLSWYESRALPRVQHLVAISPHVLEAYAHLTQRPWSRIDNPVPEAFFRLSDASEPGRILFAGSITEIKDLLTLLGAVERLRTIQPRVTLRIAGRVTSETYAQHIRAHVRERGMEEAVQFLGLLDREAMTEEYRRCAVVALSSLQENAPMTVIEAMAAGKPVVATRVGGIPDLVIEGETGYMVPVGDDAALALGLQRVLQDASLAERLGQRGREVAMQRFSAAEIARRYYELYAQVLAETSAIKRGADRASLRLL
jgi:glycosyltransferase involved in cell wall biosynthesis